MPKSTGECLNGFQQNRLISTFRYIDRLLNDLENVLRSTGSRTPFPQYVPDVSAEQTDKLLSFSAAFRDRMIALLAQENLDPGHPQIPASRAIHSILTYIDIAVEELKPREMRGYGPVNEVAADKLQQLVAELDATVLAVDRSMQAAVSDVEVT